MQGRLGGHAPKSGTRSIMVSSMGDNVVGDIVDGNVASKVGDLGDNGRMTSRGEVSRWWVKTHVVWKSRGVVWNTRVA